VKFQNRNCPYYVCITTEPKFDGKRPLKPSAFALESEFLTC
jgi:hypothetical protein